MRRTSVLVTRYLLPILAVAAVAAGLRAQAPVKADAEFLLKAYDTYHSMRQSSPYKDVPWQYAGPTNVSGRATDIAVADHQGLRRIYVAYATSGVWKTDNNGDTWEAVFEHMPSTSIGDIAVAPSDPRILWVGTGEANIFRASMAGVGIYKSTDAGRTFTHMGLTDTQTIGRILVHPTNPDIVYVAASGHEWTDNEMRGVFKTTDGGRTWSKVFYRSPRTGAWDLVMDPTNPDVLYASMWQRIRRKWSDPRVEPGYDEGGIWKTTDGGRTWNEVNTGLPAPQFRGRIGIDVARTNPKVLYAFVDSYELGRPPQENERDAYGRPVNEARIKGAEVYRTDDAGATWRKVSESSELMTQHSGTYGWVFGQVRVHPTDENTVFTLGVPLVVSRDGGRTFQVFENSRQVHADHHGLWIDPANPQIIYNANDGGFYWSQDAGKSWKFANTAAGAQFYNIAVDTSSPAWMYGSIQDHGSRRGRLVLTFGRDAVPAVAWENAPGGEGSNHAIDPTNPNIVYTHGFYGSFTRTDLSVPAGERGRGGRGAEPEKPGAPRRVTDIRPKEEGLRAQWMAPVTLSPHDPNTVYLGFQYVFRSTNRGDSWERISPDLTSNDPKQMLPKSASEIPYQTVTVVEESPRVKGLIYAGTDDGKLHVTSDAGKTWTELTSRIPSRKWYSRVVPSQHADQTVYVTQRGREDDDFAPYIYRSTDGGKTFSSIAPNIPAGPVNVIREDPSNPNVLYVGTDFGAFITTDGGKRWQVLGGNLPSTQVSDLVYHARDQMIVISTYGRGVWVMDAQRLRAGR
ncbi:MAG TPA: hypothetical protein VM364_15645 [Vicinamibacterales bacterium]|nr:hypothetical protein [Vicinamibacterales bacterium]